MSLWRYIKEPTDQQVNWGSCQDPRGLLVLGQVYEGETEVHSWHTKLLLKGFSGRGFNSISFEEATR